MHNESNLTLAIFQHEPTPNALNVSLQRIDETARRARDAGADILAFPEASLTGYNLPLATAREVAVEKSGPITERLQTICQREKLAIAYGYIERDGNSLYNAAQLIDDSGNLLSHYRKTHLWGDLDRSLFSAGESFSPVVQYKGWHIGLLICYDIEFPETSRHLALKGADIIIAPTALMQPWTFVADQMTRVRAAENQLFFAYANYCGAENDINYIGHSCIIAPDGAVLAKAEDTPKLLLAHLKRKALDDIRAALPYHQNRRPELYTCD